MAERVMRPAEWLRAIAARTRSRGALSPQLERRLRHIEGPLMRKAERLDRNPTAGCLRRYRRWRRAVYRVLLPLLAEAGEGSTLHPRAR